jgi:hypothetical protein
MAGRDRGELFDVSGLTDDELYERVVDRLRESPEVDEEWIDVRVRDGHVTLAGRVGSDTEAAVAEHVVSTLTGPERFTTELVVSVLRRGEMPEAADEAVAADLEVDDQAGEGNEEHSDTAAHLAEDLHAQTFGTHDPGTAIEEGASYSPPDRPRGDGYGSRERH